ncbi:MAG TPA: OmpA family protein [Acetobacteraceae bacterium]|nr:OmpA family protein [Acetobacteraceae bacterium]
MKLRTALLAATVMAAPVIAQAQPVTGLYVGGGLGYNILSNEKIDANSSLGTAQTHAKFNGGFVGLGSVGWGFGNGLRVEVEGDYYANQMTGTTSSSIYLNGWEKKYGVMVNALYDFNLGLPVIPYIGAGVGYQWANWSHTTLYSLSPAITAHISQTEGSFAYQGIVGAALPIAPMPGLALTAEYRFMGMPGTRNYSISGGTAGTGGTLKVVQDFNNSFLVGLRYNFGVAPPPPPPAPVAAPAPAPARTYLVFFDWDRYDLTDRAKEIIAEAAQNSTKVQYTKIQVNGYTDTSGTPQYNMGLSIRRAESVKAQLITDGVPANAIAIMGYGETHLLVPTGPGVREPQNRRVEIIIE